MSIRPQRPELSAAIDRIRADWSGASAIWLFGSMADGNTHRESDIDLAILAPLAVDPLLRFELQRDLSVLLDRDVDLVDLSGANTVLRCEVTTRGELIWSDDSDAALEFSGRVLGEYAQWRQMTRSLRALIAKDGVIHSS